MKVFDFFSSFKASNYFSKVDWMELKRIVCEKFCVCVYDKDDNSKILLENDSEFHVYNRPESLDIYCMNIHVRIVDNEKDKIVMVDIKDPDGKWNVQNSDALPENLHTNIYKWYYVTVMENDKCGNEHYENGPWNCIAVKEMKDIENYVALLTEKQKLYNKYKNYNDEKNV